MWFKKKKQTIEEVGKQEGEKQKNINEPKFKIIVYKTLGRDVYQEINSFYAMQKKDTSGSMFLVNDEHNFKESLAISKNESVQKLKDRLNLKKLSLEEQLQALDKRINEQECKIRNIDGGEWYDKETDTKYKVNVIEENKLLKQLKVLKYVINHSEDGGYDSIDGNGFRQRYYLYDEGALVPMFWDRKTASLYVAVDTAIKFYKADQDLINADYADENKDRWAKIGKGLMIVLFVILFLANMYIGIKNMDRSDELDARSTVIALAIEDSNFGQCIGTIATTNQELLKIIEEYRAVNNETIINSVNTDLR